MAEPVLRLPDFKAPFDVWIDTSDYAIGGVLMQQGRPISFESRQLSDTKRHYSVHEKKMIAVVHCLRVWRQYLLGAHFVVYTDNVAISCFQGYKKLTPKQADGRTISWSSTSSFRISHAGATWLQMH